MESSAFLAARLRLLVESQASELPHAVLGLLAPTLVEPVPSMAVVRFANGRQARRVARGTRLDYVTGGQALVCLSTTMDADLAPATVVAERLAPAGSAADGLSLVFRGTDLPARPLLHAGGGEAASAELLTALARDLAAVEVRRSGGAVGEIERHPACVLRLRGYDDSEAALPVRPNAHSRPSARRRARRVPRQVQLLLPRRARASPRRRGAPAVRETVEPSVTAAARFSSP